MRSPRFGCRIWIADARIAAQQQKLSQRAVPRLTRATDCSLASPVPSLQVTTGCGDVVVAEVARTSGIIVPPSIACDPCA